MPSVPNLLFRELRAGRGLSVGLVDDVSQLRTTVGDDNSGLVRNFHTLNLDVHGDATTSTPGLRGDLDALELEVRGDGTTTMPGLRADVDELDATLLGEYYFNELELLVRFGRINFSDASDIYRRVISGTSSESAAAKDCFRKISNHVDADYVALIKSMHDKLDRGFDEPKSVFEDQFQSHLCKLLVMRACLGRSLFLELKNIPAIALKEIDK